MIPCISNALNVFHAICNAMFSFHTDDFTSSSGSVSQYAASFGNSWRVQDHQGQVGKLEKRDCIVNSIGHESYILKTSIYTVSDGSIQ